MDKAKIRLSPKEAELVSNAEWILTKNGILQKAKYILEHLQSEQQQFLHSLAGHFPDEVLKTSPKISKGENYKGLPYLVLDYPRYFDKDNNFAIRSLFWWGNFFSITLHLSGSYKRKYESKIEASFMSLKEEDFFICINTDQWEHHFKTDNYLPLDEMNDAGFKKHISDKEFIKLAKKISLHQWNNAQNILFDSFRRIIHMLKT